MNDSSALERSLQELSMFVEYPAAPRLSIDVGRELRAGVRRQASRRVTWPRRRLVAVVVIGVLLVAASAGAAGLAVGAIKIRVVPSPTPSGVPETGPNLGTAMSLSEAERSAGFPIPVPSDLGPPDGVFVARGRVSLCWRASSSLPQIPGTPWGAVLVELRGAAASGVKEVPEGTSIESVRVGGAPAFFIEGPTGLVLSGGKVLKVPGGVVLWQHGPITLRLESLLSKDSALRLANSVP